MSNSTIERPKSVIVVHSSLTLRGTSIPSHGGISKQISATIPSGYSIVAHVCCWTTGIIGALACFDAYNGTGNPVNTYINNTQNYNISEDNYGTLHLLTLCQSN